MAAESGAPPAIITYDLPEPGNVSLAIYTKDGVQVRTLLNAEPQAKGRQTVAWDGLDRDGKPVPAGAYAWKLISSPGIQSEFLFYLGTNVGIEHWPCQHGGPRTVAVDGDAFIMGGHSEGSPTISKATFGGKILWHRSGFPAPEGLTDLAADNGRLYALMSSAALERLDPKTGGSVRRADGKGNYRFKLWLPIRSLGKIEPTSDQNKGNSSARELSFEAPNGSYLVRFKARLAADCGGGVLHCNVNDKWFSFMDRGLKPGQSVEVVAPQAYGNHEPVHVRNGKLNIRFNYEKGTPDGQWAVDEIELLAPAEHVDARDGAVAVLFPGAGVVAWVDPETGTLKEQATVSGARDLAVLSQDELLCAAGSQILHVRRETLKPEAVVEGLEAAERLSFDATSKRLLVWCGGQRQQVLVFDAGFKRLAELGRAGGRKTGLYEAKDFLSVSDIAADGHGGFMVTEADSAPRRTARFDGQGKLLNEWYGGQQFYTFAAPDPDDPTLVWMDSQWGWLMQVKVDYQKHTWSPRACYRWSERLDPMMFSTGKMTVRFFPFHADLAKNGQPREYLWFQGSGMVLRVDEAAGQLLPVACLGRMFPNQSWEWHTVPPEKFPAFYNEALAAQKADPKKRDDVKGLLAFGWADTNADGLVQANEVRLLPYSVHKNGHGFHGHGSVFWLDTANMNQFVRADGHQAAYYIRPPVDRTQNGYPIWDWHSDFDGKLQLGGPEPYPCGTRGGRLDAAGNVYALLTGGGDGYAAGLDSFHSHGAGWPGTLVSRCNVAKYGADGKLQWVVGNKASRGNPLRGQIHHPVHVAGFVKGMVGVCDYFMVPCHFWTEDGLFAGTLLDGRVQDGLPPRMYSWWRADKSKGDEYDNLASFQYDMLVGGSLFELPTGEAIYLGAGWNNVPVYRVHGLDRMVRRDGAVSIKVLATGARETGTGLLAAYRNQDTKKSETPETFDDPNEMRLEAEGKPAKTEAALKQTDAQIWFGNDKHKWPAHAVTAEPFAVRWTGLLEPRFSEAYVFSLYAVGRARLWIGGRLILDNARLGGDDHSRQQALNGQNWKEFSQPVQLEAGRSIPICVEWEGDRGKGEVHACWESSSQQIEHIPTTCLYPEPTTSLPVIRLKASTPKVLRPGTGKAEAAAFVLTRSGDAAQPLTVRMSWSGAAKSGEDYASLPNRVAFAAGAKEVRIAVEPKEASRVAPTVEVTGVPVPSADFLMDGTEGTASMAIADGRSTRLEVTDIKVSSAWNAPWGKMNLHERELRRMVDGSGLDRSTDPPTHDADIKTQWVAECAEADRTELVFDLGVTTDLTDVLVWNANTTSRHGGGWGDGNTVRHWVHTLQILVGEQPGGPWQEVTTTNLRRPLGQRGEPPQRIALGAHARYVRFRVTDRTEMHCVGLSEVEFYGVKSESK